MNLFMIQWKGTLNKIPEYIHHVVMGALVMDCSNVPLLSSRYSRDAVRSTGLAFAGLERSLRSTTIANAPTVTAHKYFFL
jgi:hypothetical protein